MGPRQLSATSAYGIVGHASQTMAAVFCALRAFTKQRLTRWLCANLRLFGAMCATSRGCFGRLGKANDTVVNYSKSAQRSINLRLRDRVPNSVVRGAALGPRQLSATSRYGIVGHASQTMVVVFVLCGLSRNNGRHAGFAPTYGCSVRCVPRRKGALVGWAKQTIRL